MRVSGIFKLNNMIRHYPWGTIDVLESLFGIENRYQKPQAEIWMGAHESAPSSVLMKADQTINLDAFIEKDPAKVLGKNVSGKFNNQLPFLFKILSARTPLSIQAHPNKKQAEIGFERENRQIPYLPAEKRNYKDPNQKPELVYAITKFKALNGFRSIIEIIKFFKLINSGIIKNDVQVLCENPGNPESLKLFYSRIMRLNKTEADQLIQETLTFAAKQPNNRTMAEIIALHKHYPGDLGVLSPLLLNLITMNPGEMMFLNAGQLHAYLEGTCVEIMANSDNVIRGGLTPKYIDIEELLKILTFKSTIPDIFYPVQGAVNGLSICQSPAKEFELSIINRHQNEIETDIRMRSIEILFCAKGKLRLNIRGQDTGFLLSQGESCMITADVEAYFINGEGKAFRAVVPL